MNNLLEKIKKLVTTIRYLLEAIAVKAGLLIFYAMSPQKASNAAASIAKFIGKKISVHKLAYKNLSLAIPNLSENEKEKILDDMWDNLGRIVGEYIHIAKIPLEEFKQFIEIDEESEKVIRQIKESKKGGILFSGHIGNWEAGAKACIEEGMDISIVYRPLNNPFAEKMTASLRDAKMIEKGASGNRKIIETIKSGKLVVILADQKISDGEPVKFFHDDAITTTAIARIALKYDVPLIPSRCVRIGKEFKFRIDIENPISFEKTGDVNRDALALTRKVNQKLEDWIKEYPAQWFWVHNRWKR